MFRKSLNVSEPDCSVSSPSTLVLFMSVNPGAGNCPVVVRPQVFQSPVPEVNSDTPSSRSARRLTSAKRTCSSTC